MTSRRTPSPYARKTPPPYARKWELGDWVQAVDLVTLTGLEYGPVAAESGDIGHVVGEPTDKDNWPTVYFERLGMTTLCIPRTIKFLGDVNTGRAPTKGRKALNVN